MSSISRGGFLFSLQIPLVVHTYLRSVNARFFKEGEKKNPAIGRPHLLLRGGCTFAGDDSHARTILNSESHCLGNERRIDPRRARQYRCSEGKKNRLHAADDPSLIFFQQLSISLSERPPGEQIYIQARNHGQRWDIAPPNIAIIVSDVDIIGFPPPPRQLESTSKINKSTTRGSSKVVSRRA